MAGEATGGLQRLSGEVAFMTALRQQPNGTSAPAARSATALLEHGDMIDQHAAPAQDANAHSTYDASSVAQLQAQMRQPAPQLPVDNQFITAYRMQQMQAAVFSDKRVNKKSAEKVAAQRGPAAKGPNKLAAHQEVSQGGHAAST